MHRRIAEYLDRLSDEERDRVITAQTWGVGGEHCLVVNAAGSQEAAVLEHGLDFITVGYDFDAFATRVGISEAVRQIKARAARPPLASVVSETETVGA